MLVQTSELRLVPLSGPASTSAQGSILLCRVLLQRLFARFHGWRSPPFPLAARVNGYSAIEPWNTTFKLPPTIATTELNWSVNVPS
jgi:hypothetical protein